MEANLKELARTVSDFLLPSRCLACSRNRVEEFFRGGVCARCWDTLPAPEARRCDLCDEPVAAAEASRCGRCILRPPSFRSLRTAAPYRGSARDILIAFKFRGADYLAPHLAKVMADRLRLCEEVDEVVAVPATARARRRGDHAAELLGAALAPLLDRPLASRVLEKIRRTEKQSGLSAERRASNVRGAFQARRPVPRRALLVDDVATSGATARECARVLLAAGARAVDIWCFARASRDDVVSTGMEGTSGESLR